jgi:hypothetical protein
MLSTFPPVAQNLCFLTIYPCLRGSKVLESF